MTDHYGNLLQEIEQAFCRVYVSASNVIPTTGPITDYDVVDETIFALENILQRLIVLQPFMALNFPGVNQVICNVRALIDELKETEDEMQRSYHRSKGRPKIQIAEHELLNLLELRFTQVEIARLYGCSTRTVRRRISSFNLQEMVEFSEISDQDLDELVARFVEMFPCAGQKSLAGCLQAQNYRIQRWRIRESMLRVDPCGMEERMRNILHRRRYKVKGPNSLWHIDGNHKLIRWRIVIHGGVDGYSRVPVYLQAIDNNRAVTVLRAFLNAVEAYGLPSRVRSDLGGENTLVSEYMLHHHLHGSGLLW